MRQLGQSGRWLAGWVALALASQPVAALAQDRVQLNSITKIEVKGNTVEITGSRRPNFTTFTLSDPPRLVIDVSEAVFADVPKELKVGDGTITAIKTASYGSESAAIARILIGFERELETDISSTGTSLVVKLPADAKQQQTLIAERLEADRLARTQKEVEEKARLEKERLARTAADQQRQEAEEARKKAEEERLATLSAEKERVAREKAEKERMAREEADRQRREDDELKKKVEEERLAKLAAARHEQEAQARAAKEEAERKAQDLAQLKRREALAREARLTAEREEKERQARAEADRQKAAEEERAAQARAEREKKEQARLAKLAAERQERLAAIEAKTRAEDEKRHRAEEAAQEERRAEADLKRTGAERLAFAKAEKEKKAVEEEERRRAEEAKQQSEAQRLAAKEDDRARRQKELEAAALKTPSPSELVASRKQARMTFVGFKQEEGVGRIFFRTSSPVHYRVGEENDRQVVITLENTEISLPNNQRIIDASFFDTAVSLVRPEAQGSGVKVTISLKQAVAYRASQAGNELTLEFERPE